MDGLSVKKKEEMSIRMTIAFAVVFTGGTRKNFCAVFIKNSRR